MSRTEESNRRPRQSQKLYDALKGKPYLHVYELYRALRGKAWPGALRHCQQQLGSPITRFNRLGGPQIVPGPEVYTYTLIEE